MDNLYQSSKFTKSNQSTDKVLAIMELLSYSKEPMRLIDIANELHYNTSTALRFLTSLEQNGYVIKDKETYKYQMTYKICTLASQVNANKDIVRIACGPLKALSNQLGECTCLAVEQDYSLLYIYIADTSDQVLRTAKRIGSQAPLHCTAAGKVLASEYSQAQLEELFQQKGLPFYTEHTITSPEQLTDELNAVRYRGYALDNEEYEAGARCIAFPVKDFSGHIIAAISVTGPSGRMTEEFIDQNFRRIMETAQDISRQLGNNEKSSK